MRGREGRGVHCTLLRAKGRGECYFVVACRELRVLLYASMLRVMVLLSAGSREGRVILTARMM